MKISLPGKALMIREWDGGYLDTASHLDRKLGNAINNGKRINRGKFGYSLIIDIDKDTALYLIEDLIWNADMYIFDNEDDTKGWGQLLKKTANKIKKKIK